MSALEISSILPSNKYLFDTSVFCDYWRSNHFAKEIFQRVKLLKIDVSLSVITIVELWRGIALDDENRKRDHLEMLKHFNRYDLTEEMAYRAGEITSQFRNIGITTNDAIIAAAAETHGLILVSSDIGHFSRLPIDRFQIIVYPKGR
jgi:predicted nucleic acid-binding protein